MANASLKPGSLPPTIAGLTPEPKTKKTKTWTEELNDFGRFLLGPHGDALFQAGELAAQFTPGAEIQDVLESSGQLSKGVTNLNPWEAGMGLAGLIAAFVPGPSGKLEFPIKHGSQHKLAPEGNEIYGKFDLSKALSGEGTNYEGAGIYGVDPVGTEVAQYYADMGSPEAIAKVGGVDLADEFAKLSKEYNTASQWLEPEDVKQLREKFESVEDLQEQFAKQSLAYQGLNPGSDVIELPDSEVAKLIDEVIQNKSVDTLFMETDDGVEAVKGMDEELLSFLNSFKGKAATIQQPGGYIYDAIVHSKPEDFLNMHMPLAYQDDKVISAVDEWLKRAPKSQFDDYDKVRKKVIEDKYHVPIKDLRPILGDQYATEHATILSDLGLSGQKWFSSYGDGRQRRRDSFDLFERLSGNKTLQQRTEDLQKEITKLDKLVNETPLDNDNIQMITEAFNKKAILENQLQAIGGNKFKDVEASLYNLYNRDPVYNYVINDPQRITITGRKFVPKGRRY